MDTVQVNKQYDYVKKLTNDDYKLNHLITIKSITEHYEFRQEMIGERPDDPENPVIPDEYPIKYNLLLPTTTISLEKHYQRFRKFRVINYFYGKNDKISFNAANLRWFTRHSQNEEEKIEKIKRKNTDNNIDTFLFN